MALDAANSRCRKVKEIIALLLYMSSTSLNLTVVNAFFQITALCYLSFATCGTHSNGVFSISVSPWSLLIM